MSLREKLNANPAIVGVVVAVLVVIVLAYTFWPTGGSGGGSTGTVFISEDGSTFRPGDPKEVYERGPNGEPKMLVYVVEVDGEQQAAYFERLDPKALDALQAVPDDGTIENGMRRQDIDAVGRQVRAAGGEWVMANRPEARPIMQLPPGRKLVYP